MKYTLITLIAFSTLILSCNKNKPTQIAQGELNKNILNDISLNVCKTSYQDMYAKAIVLENATLQFKNNTNEANLLICKNAWKEMRFTWETTESWLFGPISANNIDPRIDTWPIDFNAIDSVLNTGHSLTETYIDNLEDALKGFHPTEYFLWGELGTKTSSDFTSRQLEYLVALTHNLTKLSKEVNDVWENGYASELSTAGNGSSAYSTLNLAYVEIVDAMSGICEEVGSGKMNEPFISQNPLAEESPFSKNSIVDFTQNINGVLAMYQGNYSKDGLGIEDLVRLHNVALDQEIKLHHAEAIAALKTISVPFGEAIFSQPIQVQNAIDKIVHLGETLDQKLKPFLLQYAK